MSITLRRLHRFAGLLAVALCITLAPAARAGAAVNWSEQQLRDELFAAHMRTHDTGLQGLKDLVISVAAADWRAANPNATTADISRHMTRVKDALDAQQITDPYGGGTYESLSKLVAAAVTLPGVDIVTPGLRMLLESTVGESLAQIGQSMNQVTGIYQTNMYLSQWYGVQGAAWGRVTRLGQQDAAFTAAWNAMMGGRAGVGLDASQEQLLADPLLATGVDVNALRTRQQNRDAYLAEVRRQVQVAMEKLSEKNDAVVAQMKEASAQHPVGPGNQPKSEDYTRARAAADQRQGTLDGLGSGVLVLSTLAGFADSNLGTQVATLGKSGLAIATAINNYLPTIAGLGLGEALTSLSTMALTGNIIGAVMSVLPLFASGPNPNQLILDQLQVIRADIASLHKEMDQRFDAIEEALSVVYTNLVAQLDRLKGDIDVIRGQLGDIQQILLRLESKVDTLALFTAHALQDGQLDLERNNINTYVNYEQIAHAPFPEYEVYKTVQDRFHLLATQKARSSTFAAWTDHFSEKADIKFVLTTYGPEGSVGYLNWRARDVYRAGTPQLGQAPPSAGVYQLGARAYMALQLQNQAYARQYDVSRSKAIRDAGNDYLTATRGLSAPAAGGATNPVFNTLVTDYKRYTGDVSAALLAIRDRAAEGKGRYSPFGAADQTPGIRIAETSPVPVCSGTGARLSAPANANNASLPNVYHNAALAMPGDVKPAFSTCWTAEWVDTEGDPLEDLSGSAQVTFVTRMNWPNQPAQDIRRVTVKKYVGQICTFNRKTETQKCTAARDEVANNWAGTWKPLIEQSGSVAVDQPVLQDTTRRTQSALYGKQLLYYQIVLDEIQKETALGTANRNLTTTLALIQAYTEVAFPKALEGNAILNGLLYGDQRLIGDQVTLGDMPGRAGLTDALLVAGSAYSNCIPASTGRPCAEGFVPNVKAGQSAPFNVDCPVADQVGEHVANCVAGYLKPRADLLQAQYDRHSKELAEGRYVEGSPEVEAIVAELQAVDTVLHRVGSLAQGRPATSSSVEVSGFEPRYAVDGDSTTRWSSQYTDQEWLQVDLGETKTVKRIVLQWETAYGEGYEIQMSPDGEHWTTISSTTVGQGGTETLNVSGTGRYIRMHGTQRGTQYGFSLWEFRAYDS
ncbi:discoidin domain-containing protein [Dactylosporangium sp. NPDC000244]|uniref:discoidin domain-containing protein n=1 Tax=Dactylosporangium sp. NPDC000244 TaxID=3154365 RepID=UPI00331D95A5